MTGSTPLPDARLLAEPCSFGQLQAELCSRLADDSPVGVLAQFDSSMSRAAVRARFMALVEQSRRGALDK